MILLFRACNFIRNSHLFCQVKLSVPVTFIILLLTSGVFISSCTELNTESSPVLHRIFLIKYNPDVTDEQIDEVVQLFYGLKDKIPGILDVRFLKAVNVYGEPKYTHVLTMSFNSEEAIKTYEAHPDHQAIIKAAAPIVEARILVDYWTGKDE